MAFSWEERDGVLRITLSGVVSNLDLHSMVTEMQDRVQGRAVWPNNLCDFRGIELSTLGFTDVMSLARRRGRVEPPHPIRTALVADGPIVTGYARMFTNLLQNPSISCELFSTIAEAEAWLKSP